MIRVLGALVALVGVLGAGVARADSQVWTRAGIVADVMGDVEVAVEQRTRFDASGIRLQGLLPQATIAYQPMWALELGAGYRFSYQRGRNDDMEFRHRYHVDAQARHDLRDLRLRYRLRLQERYRSRDGRLPTLRNRVGAGWRGLDPWVPRVTFSTFTRLGDDGERFQFHKWRLSARLRYDLSDQSIAGFYRLERSISRPEDPLLHILGLAYTYELDL